MELVNKLTKTLVVITAFFIVGCEDSSKPAEKKCIHYGEGYASICVVSATIDAQHGVPTVKYKRSQCPICRGTGKVKSGDGIITMDCQACEVDTKAVAGNRCCNHCICDDCQCSYPGECLIKKNNGWPVVICEDGTCTKYMPRSESGKPYNPFDQLSPSDQRKFPHLKDGIQIDAEGNEIPQPKQQTSYSTSGGGCTTCGISGFGFF